MPLAASHCSIHILQRFMGFNPFFSVEEAGATLGSFYGKGWFGCGCLDLDSLAYA